MLFQATAVLAFAASATAHMKLLYPVGFGNETLNNSPLAPGDFPCKQRSGVYDITEMNQWNAGETQTVTFLGGATHGGGSCQFSITTDPEPTEQSQWKVIQSVMGGCPADHPGNIDSNANFMGAGQFPVTMPSDIPDGRYTFAWTWINKVGNREFYMNCAPIQVGNGGANTASTASVAQALSTLPDMFVANLPDTSCSTAEGEDFNYPNPGSNIIQGSGASLGDSLKGDGCAAMTIMGAGSGQLGTPSQPTGSPSQPAVSAPPAATSAAATAPSYGAPVESAVPYNPGGVFAPGASSAPAKEPVASQPTAPAAEPIAAQPSAPAAQPIPSQPTYGKGPDNSSEGSAPSNPSTPSNNGDCTPCTNDGAVVCIGSNQFGLCNRGCAVAQDLAAGMSCSAGTVVSTASLSAKRSFKFPRAHLHRRHGSRLL